MVEILSDTMGNVKAKPSDTVGKREAKKLVDTLAEA